MFTQVRAVELRGAHAIVTGGSSGIGLATARQLASRGATVSLVARGPERLETAAEDLRKSGATVSTAAADVADKVALESAIGTLTESCGPCDVLVTSAGIARPGHFLELEDEVFRQLMEVDYFGTLYAIRAVAPSMVERGRGAIVAISSAAGLIGIYGYTAYTPAKFAVRGLTESLRAELAPHGIHVGCVCPPDVDTPQLTDENRFKPRETRAISGTGRPMSAERVAAAILDGIDRKRFLICPDTTSRLLGRFGSLVWPLLNRDFDRRVRRVRARATGGDR